MVEALFFLCVLVWLPILFYQVSHRGFQVLLLWLFIAPVALNVIQHPKRNPFFRVSQADSSMVASNAHQKKGVSTAQSGYFSSTTSVSPRDFLDPTRLLFMTFFILFGVQALQGQSTLKLDKTEQWMGVFALILMANTLLLTRRYTYGLRVACDAFIIPFCAYYTLRRFVTHELQLRLFTRMLCYLGGYLIVLALLEKVARSGFALNHVYRVKGPFDHRDLLYLVVVAVFMVVLSELFTGANRMGSASVLWRYSRWMVVILSPVIIFYTWTRGNWLGFSLGLWVFFLLGRCLLPLRRKLILMGLILLMVPIGWVGMQSMLSPDILESRIAKTSTLFARLATWEILVEASLKHPLTGIGLNNSRDLLQHRRTSPFEDVKSLTTAHNGLLTIFAEMGVVGLGAYLAIITSMVRLGWRLYRTGVSGAAKWGGVAILAILVAYYTPTLTETLLHMPELSHVYVFACVGSIAGCYDRPGLRSPRLSVMAPLAGVDGIEYEEREGHTTDRVPPVISQRRVSHM